MKKLLCIILLFLFLTANVGQAQFNDSEPIFGQMLNLGHWSTDGLVFYWRGIQAGEFIDESFGRNNGTITDAEWQGQYLFLDGAGTSHVKISKALITAYPFTVVMWGEITNDDALDFYWSIADDETDKQAIGLRVNSGVLEGFVYTTDFNALTGSTALSIGQRIQGAFVCASSTDRRIYLNGVLEADEQDADPFPTNVDNVVWGALIRDTIGYTSCKVSETLLYNRALSASEIQQLYINPDLPMQQEPIWLMYSPAAPSGIVPIIQAHTRRRRAG